MSTQEFSESVPRLRRSTNPAKKMRTELFVKDIPVRVKSNFKTACARSDRSMSAVTIQFMKDFASGKIVLPEIKLGR